MERTARPSLEVRHLTLVLALLAPGCGAIDRPSIVAVLDRWTDDRADGYTHSYDSPLEPYCPIGLLCDGVSHPFAVHSEDRLIWLSFEGPVSSAPSRETLQEGFSTLSYSVPLGEHRGWTLTLAPGGVVRREDQALTVNAYDAGRIDITVRTRATRLRAEREDPGCRNVPADASSPDGCSVEQAIDLPLTLRITATIDLRPFDCRTNADGSRSPRCG